MRLFPAFAGCCCLLLRASQCTPPIMMPPTIVSPATGSQVTFPFNLSYYMLNSTTGLALQITPGPTYTLAPHHDPHGRADLHVYADVQMNLVVSPQWFLASTSPIATIAFGHVTLVLHATDVYGATASSSVSFVIVRPRNSTGGSGGSGGPGGSGGSGGSEGGGGASVTAGGAASRTNGLMIGLVTLTIAVMLVFPIVKLAAHCGYSRCCPPSAVPGAPNTLRTSNCCILIFPSRSYDAVGGGSK